MNARLVALAAALLLLLTACGGAESSDDASASSSDDSASSDDGAFDAESSSNERSVIAAAEFDDAMEDLESTERKATDLAQSGAPVAAAEGARQPPVGGDDTSELPDPIDTGRDIIRTATVTAEVPDVAAASQEVLNTVQAVGGLLFNQDTRVASDGEANRTTMVFRVPPQDFQDVLNSLSGVGKLLEQKVDATDVTGRVVDLESRITSTELSVERLRGFLAGASDLNQIATFENELRNRETELESLRGQLRTLQNQVALSTITITLIEKLPPAPPTPRIALTTTMHKGHDGGFSCGTQAEVIEDGAEMTVCYEVLNNGETGLADINLRDAALGVDFKDLDLVQGSTEGALEPGQRLVYAFEFEAAGNRVISTAKVQATAVPAADANETEVAVESVSDTHDLALSVIPRQTAPGFADGLNTGWQGLTEIIRMVLVVAGFLLPFIWAFPIAFFAFRAWRRRQQVLTAVVPAPPTEPNPEKNHESVAV
ncbi:MAG: DUF4349 domain-containing protein [Acidimicrobiales bacterium]